MSFSSPHLSHPTFHLTCSDPPELSHALRLTGYRRVMICPLLAGSIEQWERKCPFQRMRWILFLLLLFLLMINWISRPPDPSALHKQSLSLPNLFKSSSFRFLSHLSGANLFLNSLIYFHFHATETSDIHRRKRRRGERRVTIISSHSFLQFLKPASSLPEV